MKSTLIFPIFSVLSLIFVLFSPVYSFAIDTDEDDVTLRQLKESHHLPPEGPELEALKVKLLEIHNYGPEDFEDSEYIKESTELSESEQTIR